MSGTRTLIAWMLAVVLGLPHALTAQHVAEPDIWRTFAERLEPGKTLKVRLRNGRRFKATLLQVSADHLTIQPKTRAAVPPQRVAFAEVETLEVDSGKGVNVGKAIAIGAGVAAGAWLAMMALAFAVWSD